MKNKEKIRFLAMFLAVLTLVTVLPIQPIFALSSSGVTSVSNGSLSPENYYRLLYANDMFEITDLVFEYEKTDFEFKELTDNEQLVSLYKDATMCLNIAGLVAGFVPTVGPFLQETLQSGVSWIQRETAFDTLAEIPKRLNELGTQMNDLYDALVHNMDNQIRNQTREILNGLETLENKVDIEKYVNALIAFNKTDFDSFGGYYQWKEKLFKAYDEILLYQNTASVTDRDMKESFDTLYVVAEKSSALYNAMIGGQYPADYSVQEALFNYYLLKNAIHGESVDMKAVADSCIDFSQDLYTAYVFSQICLNLCYQYQVEYMKKEYGNDLTTKSYYLSETVNSKDRRISYYSVIKPFIEKGSSDLTQTEAELSQYYAIVLNLCESYQSVSDGKITRVIYNEIADTNSGHAVSFTKEGAQERYFVCNNRVGIGDVLYLNPIPSALTSSFSQKYTFVSSNTTVADVTDDGVVTVKIRGDFSITLKYGDTVVYTMKFRSHNQFSGGAGSASSPYLISSESDLRAMASDSAYWQKGYHFKLISDIEISDIPQIGNKNNPFYGVFDGNGHIIFGVNQGRKALFGYNYGTIKNLIVSGAHVSSGEREALTNTVGGICNYNVGLIENVHFVSGTVYNENYSDSISTSEGKYYTAVGTRVGGIVGDNLGVIRQCSVKASDLKVYQRNGTMKKTFLGTAEIAAPDISYVNIGALVGVNGTNGLVEDCLSFGNTEYAYIKSVSGYAKNFWEEIRHLCVASFRMGGLIGENYGTSMRSVAYDNNASKAWDYATETYVTWGNDPLYIQQEEVLTNYFVGYERGKSEICITNKESNQKVITAMTAAGWVWSVNPYFDRNATCEISVEKRPLKVAYAKNTELNLSGLVLKTGAGDYITEDYTVSGFEASSLGTKTVEVKWKGKTTSFEVEVVCFHENIEIRDSAEYILDEDVVCLDCAQRLYILENSKKLGHIHSADVYEYADDGNHKGNCLCGETFYAAHDFDETVITAPTHTAEGVKKQICKDCGYQKTAPIAPDANAHTYTIFENLNGIQHKGFCVCGSSVYFNHTWDEASAMIIKQATHTEEGEKILSCRDCGAIKNEMIEKMTEHTFGGWLISENEMHSRDCICGDKETEACRWNEGIVTKDPTYSETGSKRLLCTVCGAEKTEEIPMRSINIFLIPIAVGFGALIIGVILTRLILKKGKYL